MDISTLYLCVLLRFICRLQPLHWATASLSHKRLNYNIQSSRKDITTPLLNIIILERSNSRMSYQPKNRGILLPRANADNYKKERVGTKRDGRAVTFTKDTPKYGC